MYIKTNNANTKNGDVMNYYKRSLKEFKRKLRENKNITKDEWNKYAIENNLFSSFTLEAHQDAEDFDDLKKKYIFI